MLHTNRHLHPELKSVFRLMVPSCVPPLMRTLGWPHVSSPYLSRSHTPWQAEARVQAMAAEKEGDKLEVMRQVGLQQVTSDALSFEHPQVGLLLQCVWCLGYGRRAPSGGWPLGAVGLRRG